MHKQLQIGDKGDFLINQLSNSDNKLRLKARKSLIRIGKSVVVPLSNVLVNSEVYKARWEAAKALGAISDIKSIPALVKALEDAETDVVWLAAEALKKFGKVAWPELLSALVSRGAESVTLRNAAHHVLGKQHKDGLDDLLEILLKTLESGAVSVSTPIAASKLLERIREHSIKKKSKTPD